MLNVDAVINSIPDMTEQKRATWSANAARVIARGARSNRDYANAVRIYEAIAAFEATRPASTQLVAASGLEWDRTTQGRTTFRGFDGSRLVARVTRVKPRKFVACVNGTDLPDTYPTLSAARIAAAEAHAERHGASASLGRAA